MKLRDILQLNEFKNAKALRTKTTAWLILYTDTHLILGKRAPSTNNPNLWNFFGGHVDAGETPAEAAARECFEEIKFKVDPSSLIEIGNINDSHYFIYKVSSMVGKPTNEISKLKMFKITDLPNNLHNKTQTFFDRLDLLLL